jgi:hypothetical protein
MRRRTILLSLAALFLLATVCVAADDVNMGTWKLNEAKSKISPGTGKNQTVVYEAKGDKVKVTVDGVDGAGKPAHNEWTGKFDGKDYPVKGDPGNDTRSYRRISDHTLALVDKKDGKVTTSGRITVATDGKTRTVTTHSTDAKGNKSTSTQVFDKK